MITKTGAREDVDMHAEIARDYWANYRAYKRLAKGYLPGDKRDEILIRAGESRAKAKISIQKARAAKERA